MKPTVVVVGCGFLGSIFTDEFVRRQFAGNLDNPLLFVDGDTWERRNAANQNVSLIDASTPGKSKSETLCERAKGFERFADFSPKRVESEDALHVLAGDNVALVVDAVDNIKTRQMLWSYGLQHDVPVLHIGLSLQGSGSVEWSDRSLDTFSLAPHRMFGKTIADPASGALPPCELVQLRGAGLNVSLAGAMAASLFLGFDPEEHVHPTESRGWLTTWRAHNTGYSPVREVWAKREEIANV